MHQEAQIFQIKPIKIAETQNQTSENQKITGSNQSMHQDAQIFKLSRSQSQKSQNYFNQNP